MKGTKPRTSSEDLSHNSRRSVPDAGTGSEKNSSSMPLQVQVPSNHVKMATAPQAVFKGQPSGSAVATAAGSASNFKLPCLRLRETLF